MADIFYVPSGRSAGITVIDTRTDKRITDMGVGESPWDIVVR